MWWPKSEPAKQYFEALGLLSLLILLLLIYRAISTHTLRYFFIPENLILAWAGLYFSALLVERLKSRRWLSWQNLSLSALWLFLLPNTWYMLTDFIHVYPTGEISEIYDIALMGTLAMCGFILGFSSLYLVHKEFTKRFSRNRSYIYVEAIILLSSYGIYLGRVLRWNSWDVLINPGGIILNVSDRLIDPLGHPHALSMTGLFFVLVSVTYFVFWRGISALKNF